MQDFRRLLKYLRPHGLTFALAMLAMILVAFFETATGALIVPIFDKAFGTGAAQKTQTLFNLQNWIPADDWFSAWLMISGLLVGFTILGGIAEYFSVYLMSKIGQSAVLRMREDLYE